MRLPAQAKQENFRFLHISICLGNAPGESWQFQNMQYLHIQVLGALARATYILNLKLHFQVLLL